VTDDTVKTVRKRYAPGWYTDLSNDEYHSSAGFSSSQVKSLLQKTPAHLLHSFSVKKEPSSAMLLGTAVHTAVLEPEKFADEYAISEKFDMRTKAGKLAAELFAVEAAGKTVISAETAEVAQKMAESVRNHPIAGLLVSDIICESSVYWFYRSMDADDTDRYQIMAKVRPDALCRAYPVIVDLKTTNDGSYSGFIKSIQNYAYHVSAAMYLEGVNQCSPLLDHFGRMAFNKFVFVCVENYPPYLTSVYELSPEYLDLGKAIYRRAMRTLQRALSDGFTGYPDDIRIIEPPAWANRGFIV